MFLKAMVNLVDSTSSTSSDVTAVAPWVANSFPIIKFIILILIAICCLALIVVILMQQSEGNDSTTNAITGIKDTYYSKNMGLNREIRLKRATIALSIIVAVLIVAFVILARIYGGNIWG